MSTKNMKVFQFKVVLVGEKAVGKTSIRRNYMGLQFLSDYSSTIGTEFASKTSQLPNTPYSFHFQIWDIAGQKLYSSVHNLFYTGTHALLVVFDLTNKRSFHEIMTWVEEAYESANETIRLIAIIGNKKDIEPETPIITNNEISELVKTLYQRYKVPVISIKTSAKTGENINELFQLIALGLLYEEDQKEVIRYNPELEKELKKILTFKKRHEQKKEIEKASQGHDQQATYKSDELEEEKASKQDLENTKEVTKELQSNVSSLELLLEALKNQMEFLTEKMINMEQQMEKITKTVQEDNKLLVSLQEQMKRLQQKEEDRTQREEEEDKQLVKTKEKIAINKEEINELLEKLEE